ncbi:MAG: hypothetical protein IJC36_01105, partial [Clostridia bacterium]|nr:hypothetical protein [Clostridia bacterium]
MKKIIAIGVVLCCVFVLLTGCFGGGKVKATITTNSGETKEMTLDEIKEIEETNSILFEEEYVGAEITLTSTITKIGGAYMLRSWFECDAYLELESGSTGCFFKPITEEEASTFNVGDTITVSGKIGMASVSSFDIYIMATKTSP